ncbi:hypothetical protein H072_9709 [Dactylellina haptotyla CBS 200.50]|uniref:Zn(2)-C6 fungal-type domain-containing protein n=1 Tax=Dactylellina haptotyla (strain CBS 200.50) TaxID=1284197 RepID=S8BN89_DACHA|nr:hypothetical protein H072_9709 [Dactylellina haptotyla CBS 200.50]
MVSISMEHRPYRSHKVPACSRCRQRKIRCKIDLPNQPCLFCREKGVACQIPSASPEDSSNSAPASNGNGTTGFNPAKRRRHDLDVGGPSVSVAAIPIGAAADNSSGKSAIIVGPAVAEDVEIIQRHMSITPQSQRHNSNATYASEDPGGSVVYVTIPKYRRGFRPKLDTGDKQREIIEQIFGPFKKEAIRLYFELVHPCFPVIGDDLRAQLLGPQWAKVNSALLCNIYASIVPLWDRSEILRLHPRPDSDYIWNLAVSALQEDSTSPSFSTIFLCSINVIGRPSLYYVGNIANSSRVVALAHSFGLHRDPRKWNKSATEKETRIRMWWCIFIVDAWSSVSYGTPPNIVKGCYDVQLPEPKPVSSPKTNGHSSANGYPLPSPCCSNSFYSLCSLSQILAEMLPMVYNLNPDPALMIETLKTTAVMLRRWEDAAADSARRAATKDYASSNLQFCYLSVKLLFSRLSLRAAWLQTSHVNNAGVIHECLVDLQLAATKVLEYVSNLTQAQLQEFWLPYTSHLLVVATMILLRCAVETENQAIKVTCAATLMSLKDNLELHRDDHNWELGELCLERCAELIVRVQSTAPPVTTINPEMVPIIPTPGAMTDDDAFQFLNDSSLMPFDPLGGFDAIDDIWTNLFGNTPQVMDGVNISAMPL